MKQDEVKAYIESKFAGRLTLLDTGRAEPMFEVQRDQLLEVARDLRDDPELKFDFLCNIGGVDTGERFEVVYNIASVANHLRVDFKTVLDREKPLVDSVIPVWPGANWYEREMWELYGFDIKGHDDLRQLLLPDNWDEGFPMRKDWDSPDFVRMPEL